MIAGSNRLVQTDVYAPHTVDDIYCRPPGTKFDSQRARWVTGGQKGISAIHPTGSETARINYVNALAKIVDGYIADYLVTGTRKHSEELEALYAELKQHPTPKGSDSAKLSSLLVGKWQSPRHEYIFKKDGTWSMLPIEKNTIHGKWRIEGNQYYDTAAIEPASTSQYTIILLNTRYFVFAENDAVFFESRIPK